MLAYFQTVLKSLASHSLFPGIENEDHIIWAVSSSGKLSITSALSIIQEGITEDKDPIWRFIWLLQASQRVRFFLSPAADDRLMTTLHVLRDCPRARAIWLKLILVNNQASFFAVPLKVWLTQNLNLVMGKADSWTALFATMA